MPRYIRCWRLRGFFLPLEGVETRFFASTMRDRLLRLFVGQDWSREVGLKEVIGVLGSSLSLVRFWYKWGLPGIEVGTRSLCLNAHLRACLNASELEISCIYCRTINLDRSAEVLPFITTRWKYVLCIIKKKKKIDRFHNFFLSIFSINTNKFFSMQILIRPNYKIF